MAQMQAEAYFASFFAFFAAAAASFFMHASFFFASVIFSQEEAFAFSAANAAGAKVVNEVAPMNAPATASARSFFI